jgi:hypothetical protein
MGDQGFRKIAAGAEVLAERELEATGAVEVDPRVTLRNGVPARMTSAWFRDC